VHPIHVPSNVTMDRIRVLLNITAGSIRVFFQAIKYLGTQLKSSPARSRLFPTIFLARRVRPCGPRCQRSTSLERRLRLTDTSGFVRLLRARDSVEQNGSRGILPTPFGRRQPSGRVYGRNRIVCVTFIGATRGGLTPRTTI
jgi:hypothetical protein